MKYGYARVSTRQQDLEGQLRQLEEERCDRGYAGCNEAGPLRSQHARCIEHDQALIREGRADQRAEFRNYRKHVHWKIDLHDFQRFCGF